MRKLEWFSFYLILYTNKSASQSDTLIRKFDYTLVEIVH